MQLGDNILSVLVTSCRMKSLFPTDDKYQYNYCGNLLFFFFKYPLEVAVHVFVVRRCFSLKID